MQTKCPILFELCHTEVDANLEGEGNAIPTLTSLFWIWDIVYMICNYVK